LGVGHGEKSDNPTSVGLSMDVTRGLVVMMVALARTASAV
jgi:hypothetical protein